MSRAPPFTRACQTMSGFDTFSAYRASLDYPEIDAFLQGSAAVAEALGEGVPNELDATERHRRRIRPRDIADQHIAPFSRRDLAVRVDTNCKITTRRDTRNPAGEPPLRDRHRRVESLPRRDVAGGDPGVVAVMVRVRPGGLTGPPRTRRRCRQGTLRCRTGWSAP
jgi:hypothetical protein